MKRLVSAAISRKNYLATEPQVWTVSPILSLLVLVCTILFSGCKQEKATEPAAGVQSKAKPINTDQELLTYYNGLDFQTLLELQRARSATAKYRDINNAFRDNYQDIGLVIQNMGYHFMKAANVDSVFDLTRPELLVYSKNEDGSFELGAVEYAVPIDPQSPNTPPNGFTGTADQWDFNTLNTGLWTLHAWVWKNNPDGVFNMMNPLVHVQ
jgi:hypothetical protein